MDLDLKEMLLPATPEEPGGINTEYDPLYLQLEELAAGVPASQMGDSVVEGKEPDWRQLKRNCLELWKKTRDLRVAAYLSVSELCLDGLKGFAQGLEVIRYLLAEQWDAFWPRLDPDDDNDPLERLNIISMISPPPGAYDDPVRFLSLIRNLRLCPEGGPAYTLRDLMIAEGELEGGENKIDLNLLNAEMTAVPLSVFMEQGNTVDEIKRLLNEISSLFSSHTDRYPVNFSLLQDELKRLSRFYGRFTQVEPAAGIPEEDPQESGRTEKMQAVRGCDIAAVTAKNRSEALLLLRKGCEYFQNAEPTSPVPFLINRALRMAEMNFMDLLAEVDPNAVERGRDILGIKKTEEN